MAVRTVVIASYHFATGRKPFGRDGLWLTPEGWTEARLFSAPDGRPENPVPLVIEELIGHAESQYNLWPVYFPLAQLDEEDLQDARRRQLARVNEWLTQTTATSPALLILHTALEDEHQWEHGPWTKRDYPQAGDLERVMILSQRDLYSMHGGSVWHGWFQGENCENLQSVLGELWEHLFERGWAADLLQSLSPLHLAIQAWWGMSAVKASNAQPVYEMVRFGTRNGEGVLGHIDFRRRSLRQEIDLPETVSCLFPETSGFACDEADSASIVGKHALLTLREFLLKTIRGPEETLMLVRDLREENPTPISVAEYLACLKNLNELALDLATGRGSEQLLGLFQASVVVIAGNERVAELLAALFSGAK